MANNSTSFPKGSRFPPPVPPKDTTPSRTEKTEDLGFLCFLLLLQNSDAAS
ncbi:hypothetical protein LINGRAHAP2_LOCUS11367 [Linum grandiflorum]